MSPEMPNGRGFRSMIRVSSHSSSSSSSSASAGPNGSQSSSRATAQTPNGVSTDQASAVGENSSQASASASASSAGAETSAAATADEADTIDPLIGMDIGPPVVADITAPADLIIDWGTIFSGESEGDGSFVEVNGTVVFNATIYKFLPVSLNLAVEGQDSDGLIHVTIHHQSQEQLIDWLILDELPLETSGSLIVQMGAIAEAFDDVYIISSHGYSDTFNLGIFSDENGALSATVDTVGNAHARFLIYLGKD